MGNQSLLGVLLASMSMLQASQVEALALGRLQVMSAQQEPMLVELSLAETEGVLAAAVKPRLASRGEYQVAGIAYQDWFEAIQLQVINREQQLLVQITSPEVVSQTALDLLIEVDYMGGRLLGQFNPVFQQSAAKLPEPTPTKVEAVLEDPAEVVIEAITAASIQQVPAAVKTPVTPPTKAVEQKPTSVEKPQVSVKTGQTLWRVAVDNAPQDISPWQSLMAIYKANPKAFKNGRITHLMAHSKVTIPTTEAMQALTVKQAKAAYEQMLASYQSPVVKPAKAAASSKVATQTQAIATPAVQQADGKQIERQKQQQAVEKAQQEQQLQAMNATLLQLEGQSAALQQQVKDLESARDQAADEAAALATKNQALALGLESQQQSLQTLTQNKQVLQQDLTSLGQQVGVTELELQDKQRQLSDLDEEVHALQQEKRNTANSQIQTAALTETSVEPLGTEDKTVQSSSIAMSKQLYPWLMGGLVMLMLGLIFSLLWRWVNRKARPKVTAQEPPKDDASAQVVLDPLADYDAKPSAQSQHLHQVSERMELNEQVASSEAGFIEQLLQEQSNRGAKPQEDTLHLSAEVEALLQQQQSVPDVANEPYSVGTSEDDILGKLDLARSYKKMGHIDEAQALLQEVLHAGNLEQQTEATLLLSRMRQD